MVYFIQAESGGPIKIGHAVDPERRLVMLQTGNPEKLVILTTIPGDKGREKTIHKWLADYRVRSEWFQDCEQVRRYIAELKTADIDVEISGGICRPVLWRDTEDDPTDFCPFCGHRHTHGVSDGHRGAHCISPREITMNGWKLNAFNGYIIKTRYAKTETIQ